MQISYNGAAYEFDGETLAQLLAAVLPEAAANQPFAVAVNTVFVPKTEYAQRCLAAGDAVDVLMPVVGG